MGKILYLKASPRTGRSHSVAVADAFLEEYRKEHPHDVVETVDIFQKELPTFDLAAVTAKYKTMHGKKLSEQDRRIWSEIVSVIHEFNSADKYVFALPMWNFSIPYRLKQYIDIIVQPGQTFTVDANGNYDGLVKNKPAFIAYASGGQYTAGTEAEAFDLQKKYFELILGFIGFTDIRRVIVEPTLAAGPDTAAQQRNAAIEKAKQMTRGF